VASAEGAVRPRWQRALSWLLACALSYGALLGALLLWQEKLLFHPRTLPADHRFNVGADVHEVFIDVPGARLNALHLRLPDPDGVVFYLHGNAGHLQSWFVNADFYRRLNLDLFMLDYRGFGKSTGRIESQAQLEADVRAAWQHVAARYEGRRRIFFGRSLGTGLAAVLAAEVQPELTVLVSPYESIAALAGEIYPWVPGSLLRYPLRTDLALPQVRGPVLMLHGDRDTTIPLDHSRRLLKLAPTARLVVIEGTGHNDLQDSAVYRNALAQALAGP
jgi:pimeloyl-ACP methyl ester carboxylesterase